MDWEDGNGLRVVLTPIQVAAVFESETLVFGSGIRNRLLGGLSVVGGALELAGAAALLLAPEPTTVTKVAGVALGLHGSDTATAGVRQLVSGRPEATLTSAAGKSAAQALGFDEETAGLIGLAVDVGVPLIAGGFAARALTVRKGTVSLVAEEAAGGHVIARHVGRTEAQLRARLAAEPGLKAASTFRSLPDAQNVISRALRSHRAAVTAWSRTAAPGQRMSFVYDAGNVIGHGVVRASNGLQPMTRISVVVERVSTPGRLYYILTAYPKP